MNKASMVYGLGYRVYQKNWVWYVELEGVKDHILFSDGMVIDRGHKTTNLSGVTTAITIYPDGFGFQVPTPHQEVQIRREMKSAFINILECRGKDILIAAGVPRMEENDD